MAGTYDTSDRYALRALVGSSVIADIDEGFDFLRDDVSALLAPVYFGARASRPRSTPSVPGTAGRRYMSNGDLGIDMDTGTSWVTDRPGLFATLPTFSGHASDGLDSGMEILFQSSAMATDGIPPSRMRYAGGWQTLSQAMLKASASWDPGSVAAGDYAFTTVTVTGATAGDVCSASFAPYAGAHVVVSAQVNVDDQVVVTLHNARLTGSTDPASGTVRVAVLPMT